LVSDTMDIDLLTILFILPCEHNWQSHEGNR